MRSQYSLFDILIVGIIILIAVVIIISRTPVIPNRYVINEEYYIVETILMERDKNEYIFEQIKYNQIDKQFIKQSLDKMIPKDYYYIFEIPEYGFRVTNFGKVNSIYKCVQLKSIYPVNEKFGDIHIILGIWKKDQEIKVINCAQ